MEGEDGEGSKQEVVGENQKVQLLQRDNRTFTQKRMRACTRFTANILATQLTSKRQTNERKGNI